MLTPKWTLKEGKLERTFIFKNFKEALVFVNKVGDLAESAHHHPDIHIYDYKNVRIAVFTHSTQSITEKDHTLALDIERAFTEV